MLVTAKDMRLFFKAYRLAHLGEHRVRVGALAVINGKPFYGSFNSQRNLPGTGWPEETYHAEVNCLVSVPHEKLKKTTLYIARINREGKVMPSKPCARCMIALGNYDIKAIVYWDGKMYIKERC